MISYRAIIGACFLAVSLSLLGDNINFNQLTVADGLCGREVYAIAQDSTGFVWTYSHAGIDRYDGSQIKHYKLKGEPESKDFIHAFTNMLTDNQGRLWVSLKNGRIYAYDRHLDDFLLQIDLQESIPNLEVYNAIFDKESHLWIGSAQGLYEWHPQLGLIPRGLAGQWVKSVAIAPEGNMYIGTSHGVYHANKNDSSHQLMMTLIPGTEMLNVESLCATEKNLWVGTYDKGAWMIDRVGWNCQQLGFVPSVPVRTFARFHNGNVLIGVDGAGIFEVNAADGSLIEHFMADEDNAHSLGGNTITDLCVDHDGRLWASTSTNGINFQSHESDFINRYIHQIKNRNSLRSNHVNTVMEDSDGDFWFGTNDGVSYYNRKADSWTQYLADEPHNTKVVLALEESPDGTVWVGGYGIGVSSIDKHSGKVNKLPRKGSGHNGVATVYINTLHFHKGCLWIGGIEGGLTVYNTASNSYSYYESECIDIIKDGPGDTLLLGGCPGFAILAPGDTQIHWLQPKGASASESYPVSDMILTSSGDIWLATDGIGLFKYDIKGNQLAVLSQEDGIDANAITNLAEDKYGRLWFTTEQSLYCYDEAQHRLIQAQGMISSPWGYYNPRSSQLLSDGSLLIGTAEGAIQFMPFDKIAPIDQTKLIITDFKIHYESVGVGENEVLKENIDDTRQIKLAHNQNTFSITFSAINFSAPSRIAYRYRLLGFEKQWKTCDSPSTVHFTDLDPGKYIFEVSAFDRWTGEPIGERQLEIVVRPPLWTSWWAWVIYAILLIVICAVTWQNLRHRVREKRTKDKMQSFVNLAHDIRTPVSLIKAPLSELVADQEMPAPCRERLNLALKNADKLQSMVGNLLSLQKSELGPDEKLLVVKANLQKFVETKIQEYQMVAVQKGLALKLECEIKTPEVWMNTRKIERLIDNLVSNAIRYTNSGEVVVTVKSDDRTWSIAVADTGIGIPKDEQKRVFDAFYRAKNAVKMTDSGSGVGLIIAQTITRQHGGSLSFESLEEYGTTFTAIFPNRFNHKIMIEDVSNPADQQASFPAFEDKKEDPDKNTLLIVEDNQDLRNYLAKSMEADYHVIIATDGKEALDMAKEQNPDLVLSDIDMPQMRGDEMCRILKSSVDTSHIPVVLLTGLGEREQIIKGLQAGANDYIVKPFDLPELRLRLRNLLANREKMRKALLEAKPEKSSSEAVCDNPLDQEFMEKVQHVLDSHLDNIDFSMPEFCQELGMSRTSVYNKLKALTGHSPNDYIRIVRLNRAHELLQSKRYNVSEVSLMVGFADPKYFSLCFKKRFGTLPSKL